MHHKEKRQRSLLKALTYRILSVIIDYIIIYSITREYEKSIAIVALSNGVSLCLYFAHERAWNKIKWGRHTHEPFNPTLG